MFHLAQIRVSSPEGAVAIRWSISRRRLQRVRPTVTSALRPSAPTRHARTATAAASSFARKRRPPCEPFESFALPAGSRRVAFRLRRFQIRHVGEAWIRLAPRHPPPPRIVGPRRASARSPRRPRAASRTSDPHRPVAFQVPRNASAVAYRPPSSARQPCARPSSPATVQAHRPTRAPEQGHAPFEGPYARTEPARPSRGPLRAPAAPYPIPSTVPSP